MGGDGPTTFDRVVEFCDGWMPIGYRMTDSRRRSPSFIGARTLRGVTEIDLDLNLRRQTRTAALEILRAAGVEPRGVHGAGVASAIPCFRFWTSTRR